MGNRKSAGRDRSPAPQNKGQKRGNRGQKPGKKRRQGGPGRPFTKGQPDLPVGNRFQPGQSGNPGGRPRALKELKEQIQKRGEDLVNELFGIVDHRPEEWGSRVVGPSHRERILAIKELMAYGYGRPVLAVEVSGPGGSAVETRDITLMNSAERRQRLNELMAKAGGAAVVERAADGAEPEAEADPADEDEDGDDDSGQGGT